jgi:hypothetical protein
VLAAVIVTIMLVPQSLAYVMLAGLPPHVGLYALCPASAPLRQKRVDEEGRFSGSS